MYAPSFLLIVDNSFVLHFVASNYCPQITQHRDRRLSTPLIKAAQQTSRDVISLLIENGADTELGDECNQTPLFYAANIAAAQQLLKHGASVNHQNKFGETALFDAILKSRLDVVQFLTSDGADVNISTKSGKYFHSSAVFKAYSFTPLQQTLKSLFILNLPLSIFESHPAPIRRMENYFDIIKLIVPLCDHFLFTVPTGTT